MESWCGIQIPVASGSSQHVHSHLLVNIFAFSTWDTVLAVPSTAHGDDLSGSAPLLSLSPARVGQICGVRGGPDTVVQGCCPSVCWEHGHLVSGSWDSAGMVKGFVGGGVFLLMDARGAGDGGREERTAAREW